jgi:hypothetical protein
MANSEIIFAVTESPEGSYEARALGHSIFTHADNMPDLRTMIKDAVHCHFDDADQPRLIHLHLVRDEIIPA